MVIDADRLAALAARHGTLTPVSGGVANHSYRLGTRRFLRIPRGQEFVADLRKEAVVIPVAREAGVRTPAIVEYDDAVPYLVQEQVSGSELTVPSEAILVDIGRELGRLHQIEQHDLAGVPIDAAGEDPRVKVQWLAKDHYLDDGTAAWLTSWFDRLAVRRPAQPRGTLLHGDVAPQNILVSDGRLEALVDWGDAAWGDPAMEFAKLSLVDVPLVLQGYRETSDEQDLEPRVLWYHLHWALGRVTDPTREARHWSGPPLSRLVDVLRFFASGPPAAWTQLTE